MGYGRYFEEFAAGQVLKHWPGRTINEADCTWFALLTMNQHPVHSDAHYAEKYTQHKQRLVLGPLVFSVGIGMTVADISGRAIANLEIERITHNRPVFIGDTLYAETAILDTKESSRGDRGVVSVETRVTNQRGEVVMTFRRKALIPKKNHPTLGKGRLPGDSPNVGRDGAPTAKKKDRLPGDSPTVGRDGAPTAKKKSRLPA